MDNRHPCEEKRWYGRLVSHQWGEWRVHSKDTAPGPAISETRSCQRPGCEKVEFRELKTQERTGE